VLGIALVVGVSCQSLAYLAGQRNVNAHATAPPLWFFFLCRILMSARTQISCCCIRSSEWRATRRTSFRSSRFVFPLGHIHCCLLCMRVLCYLARMVFSVSRSAVSSCLTRDVVVSVVCACVRVLVRAFTCRWLAMRPRWAKRKRKRRNSKNRTTTTAAGELCGLSLSSLCVLLSQLSSHDEWDIGSCMNTPTYHYSIPHATPSHVGSVLATLSAHEREWMFLAS
jgi:hypothetical protein